VHFVSGVMYNIVVITWLTLLWRHAYAL